MMCADCGSKKVMYAESETATYSPSEEPDMVSSSSFEDPTNANFSAEGEPVAVAEGTSLTGYTPIDSIEEGRTNRTRSKSILRKRYRKRTS